MRGEFTPREKRQSDTHNSIGIDPCGPHLGPLGAFLSGVTENVPPATSSSFLLSSPHTVTTLSSATACWFCLERSCKCGHIVCTRQCPTVSTQYSVGNTTHCHIVCLSVAESQCTVYLGQAHSHLQSQSDLQLGSVAWGSHIHMVC